ncbi:MAG: citramalate synthase [Pseudomonadota bacterium]
MPKPSKQKDLSDRLYLFDTTLRDGAQTLGVDFSLEDKQRIAKRLDAFGMDYIEGGWPGANPVDDAFFADPIKTKRARLTAFTMTARHAAANDPGLAAAINSDVPVLCIVGKTWDFHVKVSLGISREENLTRIHDSVAHSARDGREVVFDCEHFFDGYHHDPSYTLACAQAAIDAGARWVVLCDTNGGTLPWQIEKVISEIAKTIPINRLGIHTHNDTGNANANTLVAVRAGVRHIQGTLNGIGERCGNADLCALIPTLILKQGLKTGIKDLTALTDLSRWFDIQMNLPSDPGRAYVGERAFVHKGGLHASAMAKDVSTYEHIDPAVVGNARAIVVSSQAGRSNVLSRLKAYGLDAQGHETQVRTLLDIVKERESKGYSYDGADASFELLARHAFGQLPAFFEIEKYRVSDEMRKAKGSIQQSATGQTADHESEAVVIVRVGKTRYHEVASGQNGPVDALDTVMRRALEPAYPTLCNAQLSDYRVRILRSEEGTAAYTRVVIESHDEKGQVWATVGVSSDILKASFQALCDSYAYKLFIDGQAVPS